MRNLSRCDSSLATPAWIDRTVDYWHVASASFDALCDPCMRVRGMLGMLGASQLQLQLYSMIGFAAARTCSWQFSRPGAWDHVNRIVLSVRRGAFGGSLACARTGSAGRSEVSGEERYGITPCRHRRNARVCGQCMYCRSIGRVCVDAISRN